MHKLIRTQPLKIICKEIVFPVKNPYIQELKEQANHFRDFRKVHKLIRPQPLKIICEEIVFPVKNPYIQIYKYIRKIKIK